MDMKSDICFIVLTYHPDAKKVLTLLNTLAPYRTLVIDNTPITGIPLPDAFSEIHQKIPSHVLYKANHENSGYTGGVNEGLRIASQKNPRWMVILNDDLELTKPLVQTFTNLLSKAPPGLAGPYPRYLDPKRWTATTTGLKKDPDFLSGSLLAIHRDVFDTMGFLYEPYFIFYEEVEYCVRAARNGFPLTVLPISGIEHEESSTFKKRQYLHAYYLARNHLLFIQRNAPFSVKLHEIARFPKTIWEYFRNNDKGSLTGIRDYVMRHFGPHVRSLL